MPVSVMNEGYGKLFRKLRLLDIPYEHWVKVRDCLAEHRDTAYIATLTPAPAPAPDAAEPCATCHNEQYTMSRDGVAEAIDCPDCPAPDAPEPDYPVVIIKNPAKSWSPCPHEEDGSYCPICKKGTKLKPDAPPPVPTTQQRARWWGDNWGEETEVISFANALAGNCDDGPHGVRAWLTERDAQAQGDKEPDNAPG